MSSIKRVTFIRAHRMYQPGEDAGFPISQADELIKAGFAVDAAAAKAKAEAEAAAQAKAEAEAAEKAKAEAAAKAKAEAEAAAKKGKA